MLDKNIRITRTYTVGGKQVQSDWNESDTTSPAYIANKPDISGALTRTVVESLPTTGIQENVIYMVPSSDPQTGDYYDEWLYVSSAWEHIGSTRTAQVQSDWDVTDTTSPAYIANKPTIPAAQVNSDWNAASGVAQILNKPTIVTPVQSDWDESDTTSLAYIANKPTIPAAQVSSDWNASTGVAQILNKPAMETYEITFTLDDDSTVTRTFYVVPVE